MEMNGGSFDDNAEQLLREAEKMGEISQLLKPSADPNGSGEPTGSGDGAEERQESEGDRDGKNWN